MLLVRNRACIDIVLLWEHDRYINRASTLCFCKKQSKHRYHLLRIIIISIYLVIRLPRIARFLQCSLFCQRLRVHVRFNSVSCSSHNQYNWKNLYYFFNYQLRLLTIDKERRNRYEQKKLNNNVLVINKIGNIFFS